jgi:hypothetical protein
MTRTATALLTYLVAALVIFAVIFRYDATPTGAGTTALVTDRWFGKVYLCGTTGNCFVTYPRTILDK